MTISGPDLIRRIENWARAQRSGKTAGRASSVESEYRNSYHGEADPDYRGAYSDIDLADAAKVNEAYKMCHPDHRRVLMWHYVYRAKHDVVCRKCDIKHSPVHHIELALWRARGQLADQLETLAVLSD